MDSDIRRRFTFLDLFRILGGVLLLNVILSYSLTGTTTWGYAGKHLNPRYYLSLINQSSQEFTIDRLSLYNGTDSSLPIYVSVNGTVFDVSYGRDMYGPGGRYHLFAGHDYSRLFVNGCFKNTDQWTSDLRGLDKVDSQNKLTSWIHYYTDHPQYWKVGELKLPELETTEPPPICNDGLKFPRY
ncbi:DEKNAAC105038 [Brettanomyces naardenensis]|uniref:DEKNAAC105038 n=1 Tax=Brettanomyces naardenensis TaxID=13370 RepID=A0A448YSF2_BRENA|nr:DEKNAAC105038 [Brettanomyces naardenensis]